MTSSLRICPDCNGDGESFVFQNCGADYRSHTSGMKRCSRCNGLGQISYSEMKMIEKGRKIKNERLEKGLTLREQAKKLGISVVELCNIEQGRVTK